MSYTITELQKELGTLLPEKRYLHTLGVSYTCAALAMKYNYNIEKAQYAGLLHDCAKYMDSKQILEKCIEYNISFSDFERSHPQLLHGKLGVYYSISKYGITDEEILEAIEYHTTGKPSMTLLSKILFISDYIEPHRKLVPGLKETRDAAFNNIDESIIFKIESVLSYLSSSNKTIDTLTLETYKYYKGELKK